MSTERRSAAIPYVDIPRQHRALKQELLAAVGTVLDEGAFILGRQVGEFECRFSELVGVPYAIGVNSGTDALILTLRALGIGPGSEVITPVNSFVASASCIALVGARPVLVDAGEDYNLDPARVEEAITPRTRAILPVHLTGRPADMDSIHAIAQRHDLMVIEDAAQSVAATYRGRPVGSLGTAGCFSLHPLKTLNACGDGGVVTTSDEALARKILLLRNLGLKSRDNAVYWSGNSRLDTLQAALLLVKLRYLEAWTEKRRANARYYRHRLGGVPGLQLPDDPPHLRSVYHTFVVQADRRDALREFLAAQGIGTQIHYPNPIHLQDCAADLGHRPGDFPVAERQARRILSLPVYPELTEAELDAVVSAIGRFYCP